MKNLGIKHSLITLVLGTFALISVMSVSAQSNLLLEDYPASYTVSEDDTLWEIAGKFLQDPERWPEIWAPDDFLDNPDLLYPGDTLRLSTAGGSPRILVLRGDRAVVNIEPEIREIPLTSAIPAIPLEAIENSFSRNRIVTQQMYDAAPYIVSNIGDNLIISTGDEIYARGSFPVGTSLFEIYRQGRVYEGDKKNEILGLELEYLGFASITENVAPDVRKMLVNNSALEIRVGDRLLIREETRINTTIFPTEPSSQMSGQIIAFLSAESLASQLDTVVINLGIRDELEIGDILSIQHEGTYTTDEVERSRMSFKEKFRTFFNQSRLRIPGKEIGTLLVYKTFEQLSYAVILASTEPAELFNEVVSP
ncbi:MAG: hypothetical protein COA96_02435 [SAR86 cluster bacterium]|uniref:LysM domain-containing protein n=1 Tax=SAR86 cluster bacterium TaxID=2030880 RepID=A0A2A5B827_9GAMM|nr:MAG: hypothetical protein COA96_02435 [SAR86 cluster bacterium]